MNFIQTDANGNLLNRFDDERNIVWDANHFCPASKLTPEEAAMFHVHPLVLVDAPAFDQITQAMSEADPALVEGVWTQQWVVTDLSQEVIAQNQAKYLDNKKLELQAFVQAHLDATAHTRNYDGILSLASYVNSTNPVFAAEGQAGLTWRDAVWAKCYEVLADVMAGTASVPTQEELIAVLPAIVWPE